MISLQDAKALIMLARDVISCVFEGKQVEVGEDLMNKFSEPQGVFVTITIDKQLRGCIGFPEPVFELGEAVIKAAHAAAFEDSRFPPIEVGHVFNIEISVLTKPEEINFPKEKLTDAITVSVDGLIIRSSHNSGLLLPQVAVEQKWNSKQFLEYTCLKAQLLPNSWLDAEVKVFKFQCQIFQER